MNPYSKFFMMLTASFIVMYAVMFFNVDSTDHIYVSTTRLYMTLLMVTPMALIMLLMMGKMYHNKRTNIIIALGSITVFILSFVFLRNQAFIADVQYMKAMIPHHSSAILTSKNAELSDPEVKALAAKIIKSQEEEIAQMKKILERMK